MNEIEKDDSEKEDKGINDKPNTFKKPILIGKVGKLPKKVHPNTSEIKKQDHVDVEHENEKVDQESNLPIKSPVQQLIENNIPLHYKEPDWSGLPETSNQNYRFEILKNGIIVESIDLMKKPFWVFGRLTNCDICMQHPTISRYHAVLQYRNNSTEKDPKGFYIYDLESTHGTFLNKNKLRPKMYVRIQVGHMLKLGCSTRSYILCGPEVDAEEESELSVTELKKKRDEDLQKKAEERLKLEKELEERKKKEVERGVDWGLGEDADEEEDLSENPYAQTNNEDLYLDDPKKALRGFYEREGLDLEYDCTEQGMGQFLCKVELPLDDEMGRSIFAEVLHKGKKKEAVVQCALEACRILDRHGLLRQATHESRKRKAKNWEDNDYYDSDDDTFLDRTGTVEKKRELRMKAKAPQKAETYESLLEKENYLSASISELERQLATAQEKLNSGENTKPDEDSLDSYMKGLQETKPDKHSISKIRLELTKMKKDHANVIRLANIAKPASLPPIVPNYAAASTSKVGKATFPIFGKRLKVEVKKPETKVEPSTSSNCDDEEEDDAEEHDTSSKKETTKNKEEDKKEGEAMETNYAEQDEAGSGSDSDSTESLTEASLEEFFTFAKYEKILKQELPSFAEKYQDKLEKILNNLKKLAVNEDRMNVDWKILSAKKRKVKKLICDMRSFENDCPDEKLEHQVSSELNRILQELNTMTEQKFKVIDEVKKMGSKIKSISEAIDKEYKQRKESPVEEEDKKAETDEKRKKKNQKRTHLRQEKVELERQRGYEEDATREDYNMWVPPSNQTGDGRTNLNDKYGY